MSTATTQRRLDGEQSQQAFDALLRALAEPGTVRRFDTAVLADGVPAVSILALALADVEVALNVDGDPDDDLARRLAHVTGAHTAPVGEADIVTLTMPDTALVGRCRRGTALAPELGARLAIRVEAIEVSGGDVVLELAGPGVPGTRRVGLHGVTAAIVSEIAAANRAFPAGIDAWFVTDDGAVTALSRSTRITIVEEPRGPSGPVQQRSNMSGKHRGSATIDLPGRS